MASTFPLAPKPCRQHEFRLTVHMGKFEVYAMGSSSQPHPNARHEVTQQTAQDLLLARPLLAS